MDAQDDAFIGGVEIVHHLDGSRRRVAYRRRQRNAASDNGDGRQHSQGKVAQMHRAPLAVATACLFGEQLRHQVPQRNPAGDGVRMRPVSARNDIGLCQRRTHPHGGGFLTLRLMNGSGQPPFQKQVVDPVFKHAARQHAPVHTQAEVLAETQIAHKAFNCS